MLILRRVLKNVLLIWSVLQVRGEIVIVILKIMEIAGITKNTIIFAVLLFFY